jgi:hypothetical protein
MRAHEYEVSMELEEEEQEERAGGLGAHVAGKSAVVQQHVVNALVDSYTVQASAGPHFVACSTPQRLHLQRNKITGLRF